MSIRSQVKSAAKDRRKESAWDDAIRDAQERIKKLRYTIRVYRERKKAGEPWLVTSTRN
jgi:hypothetical protein